MVSKAAHYEKYYSPNEQINRTEYYNEMDFKRFQNGKRKQPDYIVFFRRDSSQEMTEEEKDLFQKSQKASHDFGGLPIVVIDVQKCLDSERAKVQQLMQEYESTGNRQTLAEIYQKVRNNRVTVANKIMKPFMPEIDLVAIKSQLNSKEAQAAVNHSKEQRDVNAMDLEQNHSRVTSSERIEGVTTIKTLYARIQQVKKQREGNDNKSGR